MWIHVWLPSREHYFFYYYLLFLLFIIPAMPLYRACLLTCLPRSVSGSNTGTRLCSVSAFVTLIVPPRRFFFSWLIPDCSVDRCWQQTSPPVAGDDVLLRRLRLLLLSLWFSLSALKRRLSSEPNLHYICRGRPLWRVYLFIYLFYYCCFFSAVAVFYARRRRLLSQASASSTTVAGHLEPRAADRSLLADSSAPLICAVGPSRLPAFCVTLSLSATDDRGQPGSGRGVLFFSFSLSVSLSLSFRVHSGYLGEVLLIYCKLATLADLSWPSSKCLFPFVLPSLPSLQETKIDCVRVATKGET